MEITATRFVAVLANKTPEAIKWLKSIKDVTAKHGSRMVQGSDGTMYVIVLEPEQMLGYHFAGYELAPNAHYNINLFQMMETIKSRLR